MGALTTHHHLHWTMRLYERGHTCWELVDDLGRRWGWIINASRVNWTAHIGSFGADRLPVPIDEAAQGFDSLPDARDWVESGIAAEWQDHALRTSSSP